MLVGIDIETTGLDPNIHVPLEIGVMLIREEDLHVVGHLDQLVYWSSIVPPLNDNGSVDKDFLFREFDEVVAEMHLKSGLWDALVKLGKEGIPSYHSAASVDSRLYDFIVTHPEYDEKEELPLLFGSSVNFDRAFLDAYFPMTHSALHYRNVDISTVKRLARMWRPDLLERMEQEAPERKIHRAIPDLKDSLDQLKFFKENWLLPQT